MKRIWSNYVHTGPETSKTTNEKFEVASKENREASTMSNFKKPGKMLHKIHPTLR